MKNRLTELDSTCSAGTSLRRQLADILEGYLADLEQGFATDEESLLAAHPELADELRPYLDNLRLLHGATQDIRAARIVTSEAAGDSAEPAARQVGDYRIVREIGRGGMGIVYEAHQKSLNRQVALKILPFAAVLDQRQIARFRNEAQAAAQLHHPHIVPVFAVGQEHGVYYYAMQYIHGQSLEQVIAQLRQSAADQISDPRGQRSTKAGGANGSTAPMQFEPAAVLSSYRLNRHDEFFRAVARLGKEAAEALQHAHEYGIVHRDIKPSNLLIDEQGKLWVTDFGLARMQTDNGVTLTGDVVGTLRYMSPEQAAGRKELVDARTDVYSLGVTLYELLTQRAAHDADDRQTLMHQVVDEEPTPLRQINPDVPVDLETIVLAAMAKTRDERFASAQALADDLGRFLAGEPTLARRPTLVDRAAKWARRHRPLVAVVACAMLVLTVVSAVGVALLAREQARTSAALSQVEHSAQMAQKNFELAREAVDQFGMGLSDRLLEIPGAESVRRDVLVRTLAYYRKFVTQAGNDPQVRHELALAHFKGGVIAAKLGAGDDAIAEYEAAKNLLSELAAADLTQSQPRAQLALTHNNLALLLAARGEVDAARAQHIAAIKLLKELNSKKPDDAAIASQLAESQANLGMLLDQTGNTEQAEQSLRAAVDVLRRLWKANADDSKHAHNLAIASNNLSFVLRKSDPVSAERGAREAIEILQRLADEQPDRVQYQDDLALCYNNLAAMEAHRGRLTDAIDWHEKAIAPQERLVRTSPAVVRHRGDLATSLNNLGVAHCRAGNAAQADAAFGRARELLSTLADDYPSELAYRSSLAALLNNQALALAGAGRHEDALRIYPTAIQAQRICWQRLPDSATMREILSKMYYNYGQSLRTQGRYDDAAKAALARRDVWQKSGERLIGVAAELAELGRWSVQGDDEPIPEKAQRKLNEEVVATLWLARESGWPGEIDLATDERFAYLRQHDRFAALVADLQNKPKNQSNKTSASTGPSQSNMQ